MRGHGARARSAGGSAACGEGFLGTPAVGNIAGGRRPEVVAAGLDGRVYAWTRARPAGARLPGADRPARGADAPGSTRRSTPARRSPTSSGDGKLDIVVGAADQKVYAWNGRGRRLPGWPVLARDSAGGDEAKILSSPAVGDLDGDGSPDVVEGTAEAYGSTPDTSGRVYAWDAAGRPLPGWPVKPEALAADSIPLAGEGVPSRPCSPTWTATAATRWRSAAFTGQPELYRGDGSSYPGAGARGHFAVEGRGGSSRSGAVAQLALGANAAFGRTTRGGPLRLFAGLVDSQLAVAQLSPASNVPFEHLLGGWDAAQRPAAAGVPRAGRGLDDPGRPGGRRRGRRRPAEALSGSSGYLLHAFRPDGSEPAGWPKQTGGWLLAAPAVGDVDGDRRLEVVAVTREGCLFVVGHPGPTRCGREWPSFRHDARNSGRYGG